MIEMCGDNRFEVIARAKEHLLDATNIETSEEEMTVLDNFLFRCWQMGWLDKYDEKIETEPKWIPCSDGLPNEVDLYLVSLGEEVVETMGWNGEEFVKRGAKWSIDFITAWQPLPTPYKESEVEE